MTKKRAFFKKLCALIGDISSKVLHLRAGSHGGRDRQEREPGGGHGERKVDGDDETISPCCLETDCFKRLYLYDFGRGFFLSPELLSCGPPPQAGRRKRCRGESLIIEDSSNKETFRRQGKRDLSPCRKEEDE